MEPGKATLTPPSPWPNPDAMSRHPSLEKKDGVSSARCFLTFLPVDIYKNAQFYNKNKNVYKKIRA
jgi:hypothetical protein